MKILAVLSLVLCLALSVLSFECTNAGTFPDPDDDCRGYHVCTFNGWDFEYVMYMECSRNKLYNGHTCVPASLFECGSSYDA